VGWARGGVPWPFGISPIATLENTATGHDRTYGIKWLSCAAKRQSDTTPRPRGAGGVRKPPPALTAPPGRAVQEVGPEAGRAAVGGPPRWRPRLQARPLPPAGGRARSQCTAAHPLHTICTNRIGASISKATMRPNPSWLPVCDARAAADPVWGGRGGRGGRSSTRPAAPPRSAPTSRTGSPPLPRPPPHACGYIRLSLRSTAQPLYPRFPIIFSSFFF
jgi:hypothetical protein